LGLPLYFFNAPKFGKRDIHTAFNEVLSSFRQAIYYQRRMGCMRCSLRRICPGLPKNATEETKIKPYKFGKSIRDPLHFCKNYRSKFTSLRS